MKIIGIFDNIPFSYILVFGAAFCMIWMPNIETNLLAILCIIAFVNVFVAGITNPLYNVFTITNRVKTNAIMTLITALVSIVLVLILLYFTNLGAYAIVGCSAVIGLIKGFIIVPIYAARCLNVKIKTFFPPLLQYIISTIAMIILFLILSKFLIVNNWINLIISVIICGIIGLLINILILLNKEEFNYIISIIKSKLKIKK